MVSHVIGLTPHSEFGKEYCTFERRAMFVLNSDELVSYLSSEFAFGSLRDKLSSFFWGGGV